ncbi:MFS transporter [Arsenicicoccus cauae]|uniref:MFS transporter n=1 Tax=Arsenicicoccus cauae TaxID=2663847 RepID=UPI00370D6A7D
MLARLGFPPIGHHRRFVVAMGVDAVGSGVFMPISVLYFLRTTDVPLEQVGLALSVAAAASLPVVLLVGHLVDRYGAKRILLAANAIQAAGYLGYLLVDGYLGVQLVTALVAMGQAAFWASYSPMVAAITRPGERELWYGFLGALRNVGFAVGGLLAGVAISVGTPTAFRAMVAADAASYLLALGLLLGAPAHDRRAAADRADEDGRAGALSGLSTVLRDRPFHTLIVVNTIYALAGLALNYAMPVYAVEVLRLPGWVTGAIFTLNTVMVGLGQGLAVRSMRGHRRHRIVAAGHLAYAVGFVLMAAAGLLAPVLAAVGVLVSAGIYTVGELLAGPVLTTVAVDSRPEHLRGRYLAAYQLSWNVASVLGPVGFSWLLARGSLPVWVVLTAVALTGVALAPVLGRSLPVAAARVTNDAT